VDEGGVLIFDDAEEFLKAIDRIRKAYLESEEN
jgi:hypothetical protein